MKKTTLIHIGHCVHPHGIKGEFVFVFYNDDSKILKNNSEIFISPISSLSSLKDEFTKVTITSIKFGNKIIASIKGVANRNEVESLIPFNIYCSRLDLPELVKDEYYLHDLLGCKVINVNTRAEVGLVESFYDNGEQLILQISNTTSNEKMDILFIKHFVPIVDIENKIIEIVLPEIIE
jgi:16S rRNA processing protein RimM